MVRSDVVKMHVGSAATKLEWDQSTHFVGLSTSVCTVRGKARSDSLKTLSSVRMPTPFWSPNLTWSMY
jgi:hypothetical protein